MKTVWIKLVCIVIFMFGCSNEPYYGVKNAVLAYAEGANSFNTYSKEYRSMLLSSEFKECVSNLRKDAKSSGCSNLSGNSYQSCLASRMHMDGKVLLLALLDDLSSGTYYANTNDYKSRIAGENLNRTIVNAASGNPFMSQFVNEINNMYKMTPSQITAISNQFICD